VEKAEHECKNCGETFERYSSQAGKCCSDECRYELRQGENHPNWVDNIVETECGYCGEDLEVEAWRYERTNNNFCDDECWGRWVSNNRSGEDSPTWEGGLVEIECEVCGDTRRVKPSHEEGARFCSRECKWEKAATEMSSENNPRWKGGYEPYYGPNWRRQRHRARERDDHACQACGATKEELGQEPDVHHINPFREFVDEDGDVDYEAANDLDNLVSLCQSCHRQYEGLPVVPRIAD